MVKLCCDLGYCLCRDVQMKQRDRAQCSAFFLVYFSLLGREKRVLTHERNDPLMP